MIKASQYDEGRAYLRPGGRHVPESQAPFSLIPDSDQNRKDASFISVVAYGPNIPLSGAIQFCLLPNQNFEKNVQDPGDPAEPWIQDPSGFCLFSWS